MKNVFLKRAAAGLLSVIMFTSVLPWAYAAGEYPVNIMFDDAVTNDTSDFVDTDGSQSARVTEDGYLNKSYTVDCGYIDNDITVFVPAYTPADEYAVQFDIRLEGEPVSGTVTFITSSGIELDIMKIDERGTLRAVDDSKEICSILGTKFQTISVMINSDLKYYSVYVDGREKIHRRSMSLQILDITKISITTNSCSAPSTMYLDNIRLYYGNKYTNTAAECEYNENSIEYEPVDESTAGKAVYYKNELDTAANFTMTNMAKTNEFVWMQEADGNGYLQMNKKTLDDFYFDVTLPETAKKVVIEADFRYTKKMAPVTIIIRDTASSSTVQTAGVVSIKDGVVSAGGSSATIKKNVWNKVSIALDYSSHTFDVFLDGKRIAQGRDFPAAMEVLSLVRFYGEGGAVFGSMDVDNIAAYAGTEPRDISTAALTAKSRFEDDKTAVNFLKGKRAIQTYSNTIFESNKKSNLENECINIDDESLIPQDAFEKLFAKTVTLSGDNITIEGGTNMTVGQAEITVSGIKHEIDYAPEIRDGILYIPANAYGKYACAEGSFINDNHGMLLCASGLEESDVRYKPANLYLFFERKSADELKAEFTEKTDSGTVHPRLILTKEKVETLQDEVKTDPYKSKWFASVQQTADSILTQDILEYKISNSRLLDVANSALNRMEYLGLVYQITKDKKYAERGIEELMAVCGFADWHPVHYLDTGTLASAVAIGYDWLYEYMTDEQREYIATRAQELAVYTAKLAYYKASDFDDGWWSETETNWGIIVNGGIANLILATAEYNTDECMSVLKDALQAIEYPWYRFAPDGAWYEGTGYWSYLLQHLSLFMSSYQTVMGEYFGADYRGLNKYGTFQAHFMGPDGLPNNFHDADLENIQSEGQFLLALVYDDDELMVYRREQMEKYNVSPSPLDIIWYDASLSDDTGSIQLNLDEYYRETEFVSMRENFDSSDSAWVSFHGGYSNAAHDHIDPGTFVYTIGGVRWAVETGKEPLSYVANDPSTAAGYGPYYFYRRKGEGHNIVVINPDENLEIIQNAFAQAHKPVTGENGAFAYIDLTASYAAKASSYLRGYKLSDSRRTLTIRDEITLNGDSELRWFMHTQGDIRIIDNNTAVIYQDSKALLMQFETNAASSELSAMDAVPLPTSPNFNQTANDGITKIDYKLQSSGYTTITVKMSLLGEIGSESGVDETPISEWNAQDIPAGRAYSYSTARADSILIDSKPIAGFDKEKFNYTYTKNQNGDLPKVEATSEGAQVSVEYYKRFDDSDAAVITLTDASGLSTYYSIVFEEYSLESLDVYNSYKLTAIEASSEQVEPASGEFNYKENSVDGDLSTRWSANGTKEWCIYDLGSSKTIDAFAVAFWMGNQRMFDFEILVSDDNKNYTKVMAVITKGDTESPVVYVPDSPVTARYIKLSCHGSNTNEWNNIIEFMALSKK